MGIGGVGDGSGFGADPTAGELGMLGLSEGDVSPGQGGPGVGSGVGPGDVSLPGSFDVGGQAGPGADVIKSTPAVAPSVANVSESPKVQELKKSVPKRTRRRTLLTDEEGGLEPVAIYRRSIMGS